MGYTALSTTTADTLKRNLDSLQKEIADLKKTDKKKAAELEKTLPPKIQTFLKKIGDDIKIAKAGATTMALQVENFHTQALKFLAIAKTTLATYQKTRAGSDLLVIEGGPATIKSMADLGAKEMNDFAVTWDCYRAWNSGDPKLTAEFNTLRNGIMETTKTCRGKVNHIETLIAEAESLKKAAKEASSMTLATNEEKVEQAKELVAALNGMLKPLNAGKETVEAVINNAANFKKYTLGAITALKSMIKNLETQYSFTVKSVQTFTSTIQSMQKVLATGKSTIQSEYMKDPKVATAVKQADDLVAHWAAEVKKAQTAMVGMATDLKKAQDRIKAGK
jgi:hypothetical protein